jgi:hypothetical protein
LIIEAILLIYREVKGNVKKEGKSSNGKIVMLWSLRGGRKKEEREKNYFEFVQVKTSSDF